MLKKLFLTLTLFLSPWAAIAQVLGGAPMVPNATPIGGFSLLAKSGVSSSITGTVSETTLATIAIPANSIGANGQVKINVFWTMTNSVNNKTLRARLGGLGGTALFAGVMTTISNVWSASALFAQNSTSSQNTFTFISRGTDGLVTTGLVTSALDMTQSQSLVITGQLANTGETITVLGYTVETAG